MVGPESRFGGSGVTALEKRSCDSPQGMLCPDPFEANGAKFESVYIR